MAFNACYGRNRTRQHTCRPLATHPCCIREHFIDVTTMFRLTSSMSLPSSQFAMQSHRHCRIDREHTPARSRKLHRIVRGCDVYGRAKEQLFVVLARVVVKHVLSLIASATAHISVRLIIVWCRSSRAIIGNSEHGLLLIIFALAAGSVNVAF